MLLLALILIAVGPFLIVGTMAAFASIECPELRLRHAPRRSDARAGWAVAAWA
jgi:hypothetical protein